MANPILDGILRGYQLAMSVQGQRMQQGRTDAIAQREQRMGEEAKTREARMQTADARRRELENLQLARTIRAEGGHKLTPAARQMLDEGGDFSMELGPGFATTASSADRLDFDGSSFLLPRQQDQQAAAFQTELGQREEIANIGTVPIPEQLRGLVGLTEEARAKPSDLDDLQRAFGPKEEKVDARPLVPDGLRKAMNLPEGTQASVSEIASLYRAVNQGKGKGQSGAKDDGSGEFADLMGEYLSDYADRLGNIDADRAIAAASADARKNPKVKRHLAKLVTELRKLKPKPEKAGPGVGGALATLLGEDPGTVQAAPNQAPAPGGPSPYDRVTPADFRKARQ